MVIGLREIVHMIVANTQLEQYTTYNCINPYAKQLRHNQESLLSGESKEYIESIR